MTQTVFIIQGGTNMSSNAKASSHLLAQNPVIRKLAKIKEYGSENACTYKGITAKLVFFLLVTAAGVGLAVFMKFTGVFAGELIFDQPLYEDGAPVLIYANEMLYVLIAGIISVITPLLAVFIKATIPVTGTLFCAAIGYLLAWLATTFADQYLAPVLLALKASNPELDFIISAYDEQPDISLSLSRRSGVLDFSGEVVGTVHAAAFTSNPAYASLIAIETAGPEVRFAVWKPYLQSLPLDITSRICLSCESAELVKQMVSAEAETIGILPFPAVELSGLQVLPVPLPSLQCDLRLRAGDSPLGRRFLEILSDSL